MRVDEGKYSIAELTNWFRRRELVVNTDYQRGSKLWPNSAKSYFIDTVLNQFPFPKVYFYERLEKQTRQPIREIVDGQQRISTLVEFAENKLVLGKNSHNFAGLRFDQLTEDQKDLFFNYTVSVDVIRNADRSEILQMFRRMNAYTLPLNAAEKRHSDVSGEFKDWVNTVLDAYGSLFINWNILTSKQVVRMADAELVADMALAIDEGIVSTSPTKLLNIYKKNSEVFSDRGPMNDRLTGAFEVILGHFSELRSTSMTRTHMFHSLVCALIHNKFGLPGKDAASVPSAKEYFADRDAALIGLKRLAAAYEDKDEAEFTEYVRAASEGGNRPVQRHLRIKWLCKALQGQIA